MELLYILLVLLTAARVAGEVAIRWGSRPCSATCSRGG